MNSNYEKVKNFQSNNWIQSTKQTNAANGKEMKLFPFEDTNQWKALFPLTIECKRHLFVFFSMAQRTKWILRDKNIK